MLDVDAPPERRHDAIARPRHNIYRGLRDIRELSSDDEMARRLPAESEVSPLASESGGKTPARRHHAPSRAGLQCAGGAAASGVRSAAAAVREATFSHRALRVFAHVRHACLFTAGDFLTILSSFFFIRAPRAAASIRPHAQPPIIRLSASNLPAVTRVYPPFYDIPIVILHSHSTHMLMTDGYAFCRVPHILC